MAIAQRGYRSAAIDYYGPRLQRYGPTAEAVGWNNREKQELRFRVLCEIASLNGRSVLDVGCGLGDLLGLEVRPRRMSWTDLTSAHNLVGPQE